jgi:hypothetical protein
MVPACVETRAAVEYSCSNELSGFVNMALFLDFNNASLYGCRVASLYACHMTMRETGETALGAISPVSPQGAALRYKLTGKVLA